MTPSPGPRRASRTPPGDAPTTARRPVRFGAALCLIVLAAFALRAAYVLTVTQHDTHYYDAAFYEAEARSIAKGTGFVSPLYGARPGPAADHPPLTSLVLVPAAALPGSDDFTRLAMRFTMVLLGCAVVLLIGLLGRELDGPTTGLIAAGLAAIYPNLWVNDGLLMSETLSALMTVAALFVTYRLIRRPSYRLLAVLGVICALAALTRAELVLFVPLLALPAAWVTRRASTRTWLEGSAVVLAAAAVVVAPWIIFNFTRFTDPTYLSTGDGIALYGSNCPGTYYGSFKGLWDIACLPKEAPPGDQSVVSSKYVHDAVQYAEHHTGRAAVIAVARVGRLLGVYDLSQLATINQGEGRPAWVSYLGFASFWLLIPFAVFGAVRLRRRRRRKVPLWPLVAPVVLVLVSAVLFYGTPRFRVPAEPTVVVLAAVAGAALLQGRASTRGDGAPLDAPAALD
ncbi:MAG TPA: glycosyltransferase family 39 protein [Acidimicrobiia bacterium]